VQLRRVFPARNLDGTVVVAREQGLFRSSVIAWKSQRAPRVSAI